MARGTAEHALEVDVLQDMEEHCQQTPLLGESALRLDVREPADDLCGYEYECGARFAGQNTPPFLHGERRGKTPYELQHWEEHVGKARAHSIAVVAGVQVQLGEDRSEGVHGLDRRVRPEAAGTLSTHALLGDLARSVAARLSVPQATSCGSSSPRRRRPAG